MCNFGNLFGGYPTTLQRSINAEADVPVSKEEATRIWEGWWDGLAVLKAYKRKQIAVAKEKGYVRTHYGRRRILHGINLKGRDARDPVMGRDQGFWERTVLSHIIQGSSADLIKVAMVRIYNLIKKNSWEPYVKLLLTVHDELVFEIKQSHSTEIIPAINEVMKRPVKGWDVDLETDCEVGLSWSVTANWEDYLAWHRMSTTASTDLKDKIPLEDFLQLPKKDREKVLAGTLVLPEKLVQQPTLVQEVALPREEFLELEFPRNKMTVRNVSVLCTLINRFKGSKTLALMVPGSSGRIVLREQPGVNPDTFLPAYREYINDLTN